MAKDQGAGNAKADDDQNNGSGDDNKGDGGHGNTHDNPSQTSSPSDLGKKEKKNSIGDEKPVSLDQSKSEKSGSKAEGARSLGQSPTAKTTEKTLNDSGKLPSNTADSDPGNADAKDPRCPATTPTLESVLQKKMAPATTTVQDALSTAAKVSGTSGSLAVAAGIGMGMLKNMGKGLGPGALVEAGAATFLEGIEVAIAAAIAAPAAALVGGAVAVAGVGIGITHEYAATVHEAERDSARCRDMQKEYFDKKFK